ncbi:MAG: mcsB [Clostridiales bacterium]|jgi:protein arginine kinase|nr:mcsB [Clostridiales bacterium]
MNKWYEEVDNKKDVIISSRVRLARNIKKYPFAAKLGREGAEQLIENVKEVFFAQSEQAKKFYEYYDIGELNSVEKMAMVERHAISPMLINKTDKTGLIMSKDETMSIMINEEDHLRIQSIASGMDIEKALDYANKIDDLLEEQLAYAFDDQFGYLTSCPTNVGTGLRASYMLHTPALESTGKLQIILEAMSKFGVSVRGIYGEGSQGEGSVFQVSNQKSIGQSESDIIENLNSIVKQIADQERKLREKLFTENREKMEDTCFRAYGILKYAREISSKEAVALLSDLKLGAEMGIIKIKDEKPLNVYELFLAIQPANLQKMSGLSLSIEERDISRANYIRKNLPKIV